MTGPLLAAFVAAILAAAGMAPPTAGMPPGDALQTLIDRAPAGAEVLVRGVQSGGVVIRKPLRLVGAPGAAIDAGGRGTVVRVESPGVVVRGLILRGSGSDLNTEDAGVFVGAAGVLIEDVTLEDVLFGLNLKQAHGAVVRRVRMRGKALPLSRRGDAVRLWYSDRVVLTGLEVEALRDVLVWFSRGSVLHGARVRGSRYGVHLMYADEMRVLDSVFEDNAVGAYVMYSTGVRLEGNRFLRHRGPTGVGVALKESDDVVVEGNLLADNHVGLYVDGTPRRDDGIAMVAGNVIAGNRTGIVLLSNASGIAFTGNTIAGNTEQVRVDGGRSPARWAWEGRGNYWSDYAGWDLSKDGVGDVPHAVRRWFEGLADRAPDTRILWGSVAVDALDTAARLLPLFAPEVLVEDPFPLVRPAVPDAFREAQGSVLFAAVAAALTAAGVVMAAGALRPARREIP
ncbi:MAG: nitrous oxide reductase family maturation protein NosD [Armatimonadota bacterium]|nr:nitrous oxide reductase family maturation protein NosD [Armatimonadota bacterium]MDR7402163.1 nitrous oxide reductase family maturation protein NosD [Armatimonadota bacterium]MDR7404668.1 nitrous oxide reductase family maturation protein NosD [Armatimonadota bacterium]MDR7436920.1 nitrous oxide reductase family maturation protein NosD [Armatimonadota bacterium]MDR7472306.1 nitrous oxide reductase family maturation protein NosD [Armatimonadota bacterium]